MSNKKHNVYDPGAVNGKHTEASIVMDYANELRRILQARGHYVIRTRTDDKDPCPVGMQAKIAKNAKCDILLSLHCNAANGNAQGTETFYRGDENKALAKRINDAVVKAFNSKDRGVKTEESSQHSRLAVMGFQPCFLIEILFIDNAEDLARLINPTLRTNVCEAIADAILTKA